MTRPTLLVRNGTVVDGTGSAPFRADVRISGDVIANIAPNLAPLPGEQVHDASGCYVCPGFIESHTHYDATMWWSPDMDPLPGYGVTTVIMGNCGFSAAPVSDDPAVRDELVGIFSFFEDIPAVPFHSELPWNWRLWSEYKQSMTSTARTATNIAAYVGHIALRLAAMGKAAWERAATPQEIARMAELLEDALSAGALGLSSNVMDYDDKGRAIPTLVADDAEWSALFEVLERYPATQLQVIIDIFIRLTAAEATERLARLLGDRRIRVQFAGLVPTLQYQAELLPPLRFIFERFKREKRDYWTAFAHVPVTSVLNIQKTIMFAQSEEFAWQEVVDALTDETKLALLANPSWRARARDSWDFKCNRHTPFGNPKTLLLLDSENGTGPVGLNIVELGQQRGVHPSDAMADWFIANGLRSTVHLAPFEMMNGVVLDLLKDPMTVGNVSDVPAHGQMLCGGGENMMLFTDWVKRDALSIEEAVHIQTGKLARFFNLADRGELKPGMRADVTVFNLAEIEKRAMEKVYDVPDGKGGKVWRWTRQAAPMRLTLVNGVPTFQAGEQTDALPGTFLSPALSPRGIAVTSTAA